MYSQPYVNMIYGTFTMASLAAQYSPTNADFAGRYAFCSDRPGGAGFVYCDGVNWTAAPGFPRIDTYNGTTNASGDYTVVYTTPFAVRPHVNPVPYPPADSTTRVRITAESVTGFTVKTERNAGVSLLGVDVLLLGTSNVPSVPVRVLVVETR